MSDGTQPPEDNDLGQYAQNVEFVNLDTWSPRAEERPPELHYVCDVCGFPFKRSLMAKFRNKWYCRPNGCYHDIRGILLKENPERYKGAQAVADRMRRG